MTRRSIILTLFVLALAGAALTAAGVAAGDTHRSRGAKVLVVIDALARPDVDPRAAAGAELRITHGPTEQLSVTHLFAAKHYAVIVGIGLDRRVAVDPVAARYPQTRFVLPTTSAGLSRAVAEAAAQ
jgi:hypothetical protein